MKVALTLLSLALFVCQAAASGYGRGQGQVQVAITQQRVTEAPGYFTTSRYGPASSGSLSGSGQRTSSLTFTRTGEADGSLFSRDKAEATEDAKKTRGYDYTYKQGHEFSQPHAPITGFSRVIEDGLLRGGVDLWRPLRQPRVAHARDTYGGVSSHPFRGRLGVTARNGRIAGVAGIVSVPSFGIGGGYSGRIAEGIRNYGAIPGIVKGVDIHHSDSGSWGDFDIV